MFFFGQKNNPNRQPTPAWFKLLLIFFVIYAFVNYGLNDKDEKPVKPNQAIEQAKKTITTVIPGTPAAPNPGAPPALQDTPMGEINPDKTSSELMTQILPSLQIKDIKKGEGIGAVCGQTVTLRYDAYLPDGTKVDSNRTAAEPARFVLGAHKVMPAWEEAAMGMQKGGIRQVTSPSSYAYRGAFANPKIPSSSPITFDLEILDISPVLPEIPLMPRIMTLLSGDASTNPSACGEAIPISMIVWKADGTSAYESPKNAAGVPVPTLLAAGVDNLPVGIITGILGMREGEIRTLIIPPPYMKTMGAYAKDATPEGAKNPLANVPFPASQTIIMDVYRMPAEAHEKVKQSQASDPEPAAKKVKE